MISKLLKWWRSEVECLLIEERTKWADNVPKSYEFDISHLIDNLFIEQTISVISIGICWIPCVYFFNLWNIKIMNLKNKACNLIFSLGKAVTSYLRTILNFTYLEMVYLCLDQKNIALKCVVNWVYIRLQAFLMSYH